MGKIFRNGKELPEGADPWAKPDRPADENGGEERDRVDDEMGVSYYAGEKLPAGTKPFLPTTEYAKMVGKTPTPEKKGAVFMNGAEIER
jgi:hypothetical protein